VVELIARDGVHACAYTYTRLHAFHTHTHMHAQEQSQTQTDETEAAVEEAKAAPNLAEKIQSINKLAATM